MTAFENVMLGVEQVFFTASKEERREIVEYYLTVVGLGDAMHKKPAELSQGMRQRVGIARAFALKPKMLLLDEPFGMLDSLTRYELQQVLIELWRKNNITALMVTHDVDEALFLSDRVICMTDGPAAEVSPGTPSSWHRGLRQAGSSASAAGRSRACKEDAPHAVRCPGVSGAGPPSYMPAVENINGQAITLALKHKDVKEAKDMKGFRFCVPFTYSMHNYLLRYYLAEGGLHPDKDVQIRVVPPPEMVANLKAGNVDGYLAPDPFNQRAVYENVGFLFKLTKELWEGHPCCAFAISKEFTETNPNTFKALFRSIVDATHYAAKAEHRKEIAKAISPANYLNQPEIVLEQVLTGKYADGLGKIQNVPNRIDFDPFPWHSMAMWILSQMKRWKHVETDFDYKQVAEQVYLAADCGKVMAELGYKAPTTTYKKHIIMGREFDPEKAAEYAKSFPISNL
jgi:energy-coupling factor transporter ATP-binding protein EcfA2